MNVIRATTPWTYEVSQSTESNKPPMWELIVDPSDSMVIGGCFIMDDIREQWSDKVWENWCCGTQFRHLKSGKTLLIYEEKSLRMRGDKIVEVKTLKYKEIKRSKQIPLDI